MKDDRLTRKVIGYRMWRLVDGELRPSNENFSAWKVGENRAKCEKDSFLASVGLLLNAYTTGGTEETAPANHDAPHAACDCGFYGWHSLERLAQHAPSDGVIHGAFAAWGKVEVHADGFRAEYAQPVVFGYSDLYTLRAHRAAEEFAHTHGIRLVSLEELPEFASVFGQPVPEDLRPEKPVVSGIDFATINLPSSALYFRANQFNFSFPSVQWTTADYAEPEDTTPEPVKRARKKHRDKSSEQPPKFPRKGRA